MRTFYSGRGASRGVWVLVFVVAVLLLGTLAATWNVVYIERLREVELKSLPRSGAWVGIVLGSLGFVGLLGGMILFFVRLLQEMKLNQLQSEFIAAVSHELKTPIATIELSSSLIRSGGLSSEESTRLWSSHDAELQRLKSEVEALLAAAQWQSNAMQSKLSPTSVEEWLNQSMDRWRHILGPGATLDRNGERIQGKALIDPRMLTQVADNLIDNARKFSRGVPEVAIRTRQIEGHWQITFQDQGWGFDPADADRIFKRFVRGKNDAPYAIPGTGLGLFLARSASQAMKIRLSGESAGHGKGATFRLEGPLL